MQTVESNNINGIRVQTCLHWPVAVIQVIHPGYDYPIYEEVCTAWGWRKRYRAITALVALISRDAVDNHDNADRMDDMDER